MLWTQVRRRRSFRSPRSQRPPRLRLLHRPNQAINHLCGKSRATAPQGCSSIRARTVGAPLTSQKNHGEYCCGAAHCAPQPPRRLLVSCPHPQAHPFLVLRAPSSPWNHKKLRTVRDCILLAAVVLNWVLLLHTPAKGPGAKNKEKRPATAWCELVNRKLDPYGSNQKVNSHATDSKSVRKLSTYAQTYIG